MAKGYRKWYDIIIKMINNPKKMALMGQKARLLSKDYTLENWQNLIGSTLNKQWGPLK